jgi:RNA-directed DNA polymerase
MAGLRGRSRVQARGSACASPTGSISGTPSRRWYIPKPDGRERPLAVAALEDKIVQRAVAAVLNAIYEEDFLGFSYGFRPKRGQHDALDALVVGITTKKVNFIFDADIRSYFDSANHAWLIRFLQHRINDPRMIRIIQKWLKAGILENGVVVIWERGKGRWHRHCSPMSTCTTSSTCGLSAGDGARRRVT